MAGVALHPNEAPRLAAAGELDEAWDEIARAGALAVRPRGGGDRARPLPHRRPRGARRRRRASVVTSRLARELGKTLVIHDRDAHADVLRVVDEEGAPERVVMHCFSGDAAFARACLDRGFWLSFSGTVTFKNAGDLREACRVTPADRLLVETDAPFLTPVPHRGRANASYLVPLTMRAMADGARGRPGRAVRAGRGQHLRGLRGPVGRRPTQPGSVWTDPEIRALRSRSGRDPNDRQTGPNAWVTIWQRCV